MKKLAFLITLTLSGALFGQTPWWTSTDSVHVFSRNTGSVLVGSYEPLGKLTLGTDALNTSLALVGDYNNFAKNYLKIGVLGRSTDKMQGRAFFDLYHSNANPRNVGYHFRINNKNLFYINAEGNVGIGTDQPQAGLDIQSAASWGSFKKGLRLAPDNALAIDAGTIKYGIVGNGDNLHFFTTNSDEKVSPFGNAFNKLMTFQPKKVVIEGDLEVRGKIIYAGGTFDGGSGSGGQSDGGGETPSGEGSGGDIDPPKGFAGGTCDADGDSIWENCDTDIFSIWRSSAGKFGLGTSSPTSKLTISPLGSTSATSSLNIGNALLFVRDDGNVGINQASPGYKLDVNGTSRVSGAATFSNTVNFPGGGIWNTSGNVGIGITSPTSRLHVKGSGATSGTSSLNVINSSSAALFLVRDDGNVGIGTSTPGYKLDVNGTTRISGAVTLPGTGAWTSSGNVGIGVTNPTAKLELSNGPLWTDHPYFRTLKLLSSSAIELDGGSSVKFGIVALPSGQFRLFTAPNEGTEGAPEVARIVCNSNGYVGIGTTSPTELLSVNGNIRTKKVIVTQQSWSDFVFDETYPLRPLSEVHEFIQTHRHLPDIPDQKEIADQGMDVGDMQAKLLQKIEELTLYLIEQDRRINDQQGEIDTLRAHIK